MKRFVVYVAGPLRAKTAEERSENVVKAAEVAAKLWEYGIIAICPHTMTEPFRNATEEENFMLGMLEIVTRCDAIFLLDGHMSSEGTKNEKRTAKAWSKPSFRKIEDIVEHAKKNKIDINWKEYQ